MLPAAVFAVNRGSSNFSRYLVELPEVKLPKPTSRIHLDKPRELSPYGLILTPVTYLIGIPGIWSVGVHGQSEYDGRYFMFVYFGIFVVTFLVFPVQRRSAWCHSVEKSGA